ncbi:putative trafficking pga2 [Erysiphe neolycopersici]|uniref:Putative trafficking pga2 n=1 Tax=Erysiphe neolycopersici TaxID=212602 RepID=A0A420HPD3_9PEZI|nr:putative trafficking pga2 [Erysiphe neolycopersici]
MSKVISSFVRKGGDNLVRNVTGMWDGMGPRDYIRIVIIVGAYLLIRPYLLKFAAKIQAKEYAKHNSGKNKLSETGKITPNDLRDGGQKKVDKTESVGITSGAGWGENARRRQKEEKTKSSKQQEQQTLDVNDEKKEIKILDYLVDYEEGKEGW